MPGRKLTIVHVVGQLEMGGMEQLLLEFARHADRDRFHLHFVSLGERGLLADDLENLGWPVTALGVRPGLSLWPVLKLARLFRRLGADAVHTHNTKPLLLAGPAARLARVPRVIHTRHGQRVGNSRRPVTAFRLAALTADHVVCVSHDCARVCREQGVSPRRIRVVWNGIDLDRFKPTVGDGSGPVVAVGRLSPEKDFETLVRAVALAARQDPTFRLEIAGDGVCMAGLRRLIDELNVHGAVRLLGLVRDVPALLSRAVVFTLSSLTEGVSLTILEAMASGVPVVATRVGGNPEVVADGETGLLVPPADPSALAAALLAQWRDAATRRAMGAAGRARVEACFDVRKMVARYETLYTKGRQLQVKRIADPIPRLVGA